MRTTLEDNATDAKRLNNESELIIVDLKNNNAELNKQITVLSTDQQETDERCTQLETDVQMWKVNFIQRQNQGFIKCT